MFVNSIKIFWKNLTKILLGCKKQRLAEDKPKDSVYPRLVHGVKICFRVSKNILGKYMKISLV